MNNQKGKSRVLIVGLALLLLSPLSNTAFGQLRVGQWKEVVGKKVYSAQGDAVGTVRDIVLDVEHGRYVGVIVASGGVLGIGSQEKVVPPGALTNSSTPRALILNVDKSTFRDAPSFEMSKRVGPPDAAKVAEVYRYYGQQPYFSPVIKSTTPQSQDGRTLNQIGYVQRGSQIRSLPVENLQGELLGTVVGFRGMERETNSVKGIIISPGAYTTVDRIVPPLALRYNPKHTRLQLNDNEMPFNAAPAFAFAGRNRVLEEPPVVPSIPQPPVAQGDSERDKQITLAIQKNILADGSLSHYAHNVQVGTVRGRTTVQGRVETRTERDQITAYAAQVAGARNVAVNLEIRPMNASEAVSNNRPATVAPAPFVIPVGPRTVQL